MRPNFSEYKIKTFSPNSHKAPAHQHKTNIPEEKKKSYWAKETHELTTAEKIVELKKEYNDLLKKYNLLEDGTYTIINNAEFNRINQLLINTACCILNHIEGKPGNYHWPVDYIQSYFGKELIKGFK